MEKVDCGQWLLAVVWFGMDELSSPAGDGFMWEIICHEQLLGCNCFACLKKLNRGLSRYHYIAMLDCVELMCLAT
jgi:hypothetical protein